MGGGTDVNQGPGSFVQEDGGGAFTRDLPDKKWKKSVGEDLFNGGVAFD